MSNINDWFSASSRQWLNANKTQTDHVAGFSRVNITNMVYSYQDHRDRSWPWRHHWHSSDSVCTRHSAVLSWLLSAQTTMSLTHLWSSQKAFISIRLDYCNSVLFGVSDSLLRKIQSVQNAAARLITQTTRWDHITPVLWNFNDFQSTDQWSLRSPAWFTNHSMTSSHLGRSSSPCLIGS